MTPPETRDAAEALFLAAVDADPASRAALLAAAPAGLRAEVESLIEADAHADTLLDPPPGLQTALLSRLAADAGPELEGAEDLVAGTRVGPWRVEAEAGRGGMGTVYRASRADGLYEQTVALKVVRRGMDSADVVARFARERALLAGLDHAGIARLVDGGRTPDGRPYLAMEFVDGEPITHHCDARRLAVADRLELFVQVCEAVAYAHRHLVVHRDLKPSNVLVTETSGRAAAKLLDFGVARLLTPDGDQTQTGRRMLTPAYAAPEQVAGGPVTTSADLYSLGVLLHELLTGHRPRTGTTTGRPSAAVVVPSVRRSAAGETQTVTPEALAAARGATPARLARRLRGDLDAIVLKALRPEPELRYPSADAFADDVRRTIAGLPVRARRGTTRYRAASFVRRHRAGVAAAALVGVVLMGAAGVLAVQNRQVVRERDRAEATTGFLRDLLAQANALSTGRGDVTVAEVLGAAGRRIPAEFADQPDVRAALLYTIGDAYTGLSQYHEAERPLRQALALWRGMGEGDHPETVGALRALSFVLTERGSLDSAAAMQREALAMAIRLEGRRSLTVSGLMTRLAWTEKERGHYPLAERLIRESIATSDALARAARASGSARPDSAASLEAARGRSVLSIMLMRRGSYDEAERLERATLATRERLLGPRHPLVALSLSNLSKLLEERGGPLDEALALTDRALALRQKIGGDSSLSVLTERSNRSAVLRGLGRHAEAVREATRAYETSRAVFGDAHTSTAYAHYNLARALDAAGQKAEAERHYAGALAEHEAIWGRDHAYTAYVLVPYARLLLARGEPERARALAAPAVRARRAALGPGSWLVADAEQTLGRALLALGRAAEARTLLDRSDALARAHGPNAVPPQSDI
jgi:tetratricopeptide (TPR) repeat protein